MGPRGPAKRHLVRWRDDVHAPLGRGRPRRGDHRRHRFCVVHEPGPVDGDRDAGPSACRSSSWWIARWRGRRLLVGATRAPCRLRCATSTGGSSVTSLPTAIPQSPGLRVSRRSHVTPVATSIHPTRTLSSSNRSSRRPLVAVASALVVSALAALALQGAATGRAAARRAVASEPVEDAIAAAAVNDRNDVARDPLEMPAQLRSAPSALPVTMGAKAKPTSSRPPLSPVPSAALPSAALAPSPPSQPDLKALFDRRR